MIFEKLPETKVIRDPIHKYINIEYKIIWQLIDTFEMQRLRKIHQLGATMIVFATSEHSRFTHCLGVYQLTKRIVEEVWYLRDSLSEREYVALLCSALLHDIGHGPYSHAFEEMLSINHEKQTQRVILEETAVNAVLRTVDNDFPKEVAEIIAKSHPNKMLIQIISSQIDADRMDYLLRDAYFSGAIYGNYDLERIIRVMRFVDGRIVFKESGIHAIENYVIARYHMYWQVYFHPTSRSYEAIIGKIIERYKELYKNNHQFIHDYPYLRNLIKKRDFSISEYLMLDEHSLNYYIYNLGFENDAILKDLSNRISHRRLFDYCTVADEEDINRIKERVIKAGYDIKYYFLVDHQRQVIYKESYYRKHERIDILIKKTKKIKQLPEVSRIVNAIVNSEEKDVTRVFFPKL